jgi:hypothetical protein
MACTVNGIGTSVCGDRGDVGFGSFDAIECFVVAFLPVLPLAPVHTFDWNGLQFRAVGLRWSWVLAARAFVNRWRWVGILGGGFLLAIGLIELQRTVLVNTLLTGGGMLAAGLLGWWWLRASDRRTCDIRRVLGPHLYGSCDPVLLRHGPFGEMQAPPQVRYEVPTYLDAVPKLLEAGRYSEAMWAAAWPPPWKTPSAARKPPTAC